MNIINGVQDWFSRGIETEIHDRKDGLSESERPYGRTKLALCINRQLLGDWFNRQFNKLRRHIHTYRSRNGKAGVFKLE